MKDKSKQKAAALRYRHIVDDTPTLVAKGSGDLAEQIIQAAIKHGVPITEDKELVEFLSMLDLYREIPPDLYKAVSEILVFVYAMTLSPDTDLHLD